MNYCPLAFLESSGRNRTPDKLAASEKAAVFAACDRHLRAVVAVLRPEWVVGVGSFAALQTAFYMPDTFGFPASLPMFAQGCGSDCAIFMRGTGRGLS